MQLHVTLNLVLLFKFKRSHVNSYAHLALPLNLGTYLLITLFLKDLCLYLIIITFKV